MKLNINFVPAIVTVLFLMTLVGFQSEQWDTFVAEQGPVRYLVPSAPPGLDSLGIPEVYGYGAAALTTCIKDTVIVETVTSLSGDTSVVGTYANILLHHQHGDTLVVVTWGIGGWSEPIVWFGQGGYTGNLNCVYLAGQTAPGEGVGYRRNKMLSANDDSKDFVIRGITWAGDPHDVTNPSGTPNMAVTDAQTFIFTENTHLWNREKHIVVGPSGANDTVAYATFYRNAYGYSQAMEPTSIQAGTGDNGGTHTDVTWARNLWHSVAYRAPLFGTGHNASTDPLDRLARMLGNVFYNTGQQSVLMVSGWALDVIDSYCKGGPATNDGGQDYSWCVVVPLINDVDNVADTVTSLYVERIIGGHNRDTLTSTDSLWYPASRGEAACYYRDCIDPAGGGDVRDSLTIDPKRDTPLTAPTFEFARINPFTLKDEILGTDAGANQGQVGAYRHLKCDGTFELRADSMLAAMLKEARDSTGVSAASQIDSLYVDARYLYTKGTVGPCDDTDSDGMPDQYEDRMADLDKNSATDRSTDSDLDGWTAMEEYVNGTRSDTYTRSDGTEGEGGGGTTTYNNLRNAYLVPLDSVLDTLGSGEDTMILWRYIPDRDSVPLGYAYKTMREATRGSLIVLTYDTIDEIGAGNLDSADVDIAAAALGITYPPYPWAVSVPGGP